MRMACFGAATVRLRFLRQEVSSSAWQQPRDDFVQRRVGSCFDLGASLILDGMRHVDGVEIRPPECGGLGASREREFARRHRHCGNAPTLDPDRVVQTARGARPSIGQGLDDGAHAPHLFKHLRRRRLGVGRFGEAYHALDAVALD